MAIEVIDKIKPKNNGGFAVVDALDVEMPGGTRLSDFKPNVELTEEQIAALKGKDGKDGYTPVKGVDYFDGKDGINGKDGVDGKNGSDGKTPVKGTDYWTDADKQEMVEETSERIEALFVSITQDEYDNLFIQGEIDSNKYYMIVGDGG